MAQWRNFATNNTENIDAELEEYMGNAAGGAGAPAVVSPPPKPRVPTPPGMRRMLGSPSNPNDYWFEPLPFHLKHKPAPTYKSPSPLENANINNGKPWLVKAYEQLENKNKNKNKKRKATRRAASRRASRRAVSRRASRR